jgi:predicted DNA-binding protein (MmcQ/YjbR family)
MTINAFREMALAFPGTEENPHFDRAAFKVVKKRIFATLHEEQYTANLKLSPADQRMFCKFDKAIVFPIPNKWGEQGWTIFDLKKIPNALMLDALNAAYQDVFKSKKR